MSAKLPREMTGAELKSMLKSSINFKSLGGVRCPELKLKPEDLQWWRDAKIGMFIHWGLYSVIGHGEWAKFNEQIPDEEYQKVAENFKPQGEDITGEWVRLAKDFGAKYMVMVARHHDGFSMWNSPGSYQGFTTWNYGAKRDFVKEYTDSCRAAGLRVGVYYSPMDWRFPGYFAPKVEVESAQRMKKQCYDQVRELMSNYGKIDILWYDGGWLNHEGSDTSSAWFWEPVKLNKMVKSINPKVLVNPRSGYEGDFYCDEGSHEISGKIIPVPWEKNMCVCSGSSWGWIPDDPVSDFDWLIRMMVNVVSRDGNWLVNVGPDKDGVVPAAAQARMREIGDWLKENGESIYGTRGGPFEPVDNVYGATSKGNTIYIHVMDRQAFAGLSIPSAGQKVLRCELLHGGALPFEQNGELKIRLSENLPSQPDTIVKLTVAEPVQPPENKDVYFTGKE